MKRAKEFFMITFILLSGAFMTEAYAQGKSNRKGHAYGNDKNNRNSDRNLSRDQKHYGQDKHRGHNHHAYRHHDHSRIAHRHHPVYVHQHRQDCGHRILVRRVDRPRYVYYSDYDVYFDVQRNVYISYVGRNWNVSTSIPVVMHRVDIRRAASIEVNYYDDDFVTYLDRGRPMYAGIYVGR